MDGACGTNGSEVKCIQSWGGGCWNLNERVRLKGVNVVERLC